MVGKWLERLISEVFTLVSLCSTRYYQSCSLLRFDTKTFDLMVNGHIDLRIILRSYDSKMDPKSF